MIGPRYHTLIAQNNLFSGDRPKCSLAELELAATNAPAVQDAIIAAGGLDLFWCKTRSCSLPIEQWPIDLPDTPEMATVPIYAAPKRKR